MKALSVMIKPASGLCNMHCDYCFYCDEIAKREQACYGMMSETTLKNVIRKTLTKVTGTYTLAFQGGEPTLCGLPFFQNAVKYTKQYNRNQAQIQFALQTNGFALTKEWAEFFAENHFLIGISVDGLPEIHDKYRHGNHSTAEGTYDRVMESIRLLEEYQVDYNILTVVHKETAERIKEIYPHYRKKGWDFMQFITCLDPLGELPGQKDYSLLPETYGRFLIDLFDLWYEDVKGGNAPYIRQFENYCRMHMGYRPEACDMRGHCGMQYIVEADGSVYPCDFYVLDKWKLGNFNEARLEQIDTRRLELGFLERSDFLPDCCKNCQWLSMCRGGCYRCRSGEVQAGVNLESGKNYFCQGYKMFFEACDDRMKAIAEMARMGKL